MAQPWPSRSALSCAQPHISGFGRLGMKAQGSCGTAGHAGAVPTTALVLNGDAGISCADAVRSDCGQPFWANKGEKPIKSHKEKPMAWAPAALGRDSTSGTRKHSLPWGSKSPPTLFHCSSCGGTPGLQKVQFNQSRQQKGVKMGFLPTMQSHVSESGIS